MAKFLEDEAEINKHYYLSFKYRYLKDGHSAFLQKLGDNRFIYFDPNTGEHVNYSKRDILALIIETVSHNGRVRGIHPLGTSDQSRFITDRIEAFNKATIKLMDYFSIEGTTKALWKRSDGAEPCRFYDSQFFKKFEHIPRQEVNVRRIIVQMEGDSTCKLAS